MDILFLEVGFWADRILRWFELIEILSESRVMTGAWTSKENVIFSAVDLLCITKSSFMLLD